MAFTYNLATAVGKLRLALSDTDSSAPKFQDDELQAFLDAEYGSLRLAAADALTALAAQIGSSSSAESVKIGDFEQSSGTSSKAAALLKAADALRELEYNTPAFAVAEENLSPMNEVIILKNWILRTQLP